MVNSNVVSVTASVSPPPPGMGTLLVDTAPVKGDVLVDGVSQGTAPVIVNVAAGSHAVSFGPVTGYTSPRPQTVEMGEGETVTVSGTYAPTAVPSVLPCLFLGGGAIVLFVALIKKK